MWLGMDPLYWAVIGVGMLLSLWAQAKVKGNFVRFSEVGTRGGYTGADIARRILADHGIRDVSIEPVAGKLSDHYDPRTKTLRLSEPVFGGRSISAAGIAAHEVGHAIQHAHGYEPLKFRSAWVPLANTGGGLSMIIILIAMVLGGAHRGGLGETLAWVGIGLFSMTTIFTLVTLPVEFDASKRALATLASGGYLTQDELGGAKKVLDAAALTYVAAFVTSLMMLLYYAYRLGLFGGRSQDS